MSSPPRPAAKSRKQTRREALAALKSARASRGAASGLDAVDFDDEEDVFETMDEEQYREYVERRREREDFVVDDDGLGYHDDGDYDVAGAAARESRPQKKTGGGAGALTKEALRQARKAKAARGAKGGDGGGGGSGGSAGGGGNKTMWDFVNKGSTAKTGGALSTGTGGERTKGSGAREAAAPHGLDDMLDELDGAPTRSRGGRAAGRRGAGSRRRPASRGREREGPGASKRRAYGSREPRSRHPSRGRAPSARREREDHRPDDDEADFGGDGPEVDFGDNNEGGDVFASGAHDDGDDDGFDVGLETQPAKEDVEMEDVAAKADDGAETEGDKAEEAKDEEATAAPSRARPGRLAGRLAAKKEEERRAAAAKKLAEERKALEAQKRAETKAAKASQGGGGGSKPGEIALDVTSTSFHPASIAAAGTHEAGLGGGTMDLERILQVEEADAQAMDVDGGEAEGEAKETNDAAAPRPYLDLYWLDAAERRGVVTLYGKVKVPLANGAHAYQSCCVAVPGNERNLFVLPRLLPAASEDDAPTRHNVGEVYSELKAVLQPSCIPLVQGANWKAKPVTRSYAFEDPSVPRGECQYLKVVYDGKYPVPDRQVCVRGGKTFEKILGAGASNLENFLVKRRLMGPGWVRIYDPTPMKGGNVSWCKWECTVDGPKSLKRLDLVSVQGKKVVPPPPPPVSAVSLKFKTAVHPKSHKLEIVCASAVCHAAVQLDAASDESTKHMTQLTLVRPCNYESHGAAARFPRDMEQEVKAMPELQKSPNERALLSRLFAQLGTWDPDVLVAHNGWGHDVDVLLNRCVELKVGMWSKIGRRRQMRLPSGAQFGNGKEWALASALEGRVLCDTYLSAKEFLRETTYSLTNLAKTQLKAERLEIEQVDVPHWCRTGKHLVALAKHTLNDAQLVQALMFKLQVLPLTKQLTNIAGNLWGRTLKGNRAERNEYLLLHEFHALKYVVPEKRSAKQRQEELLGEEGAAAAAAGGKDKAKYSGGLVLEPKKGLYDSFILLLDFNSLYPSLIQEYNLCFTTMDWASGNAPGGGDDEEREQTPRGDVLPGLPDEGLERGVLPRVIKTLVDRRRNVKKFMKNEKDADKREELNIRQLALKLTANSMYGCLGFSHSRFYAQPIAALVTAMGRETLQRTVDLAQTTIGLEVIYGDTDSIMINTRITDLAEYPRVLELGNKVKREVNRLYKTLELEIDGVFRSMLLLKKKKYAAVTIEEKGGRFAFAKEMKGLDLVRRDWCIQSKDSGKYVLDQILSGEEKEVVVHNIHEHLEGVARKMRSGELPLDKYVITKGLNKHPNDYPDAKSLPHVFVAKRMLQEHKAVNIGAHIPYVITEATTEEGGPPAAKGKKSLAAERARHPDDVARSDGALKPDVEWYLTQQILPPISRLCEPIEGTSPGILAEKLGLDSSKYNNASANVEEDDMVDYTPASCLPDEERFKDVEKLVVTCAGCGEGSEFPGVFRLAKDADSGTTFCQSGLRCPHPGCQRADHWGEPDAWSCIAKILNATSVAKKGQQKRYYDGLVRCDDPMCGLETRQLSVYEGCCLKPGCNGRMKTVYTESALQAQLKYYDSLFDLDHACKQLRMAPGALSEKEVVKSLANEDKEAFQLLHGFSSHSLNKSGYNWVSGQFFRALFGGH
ncbi:hypothetical protein ACHAXT_006034 [Thalassiosira profunda]